MLLEEAIAPTFAGQLLLRERQPLQQRHLLLSYLLEAVEVEPPHLAAGDSEQLAEQRVRDVGRVAVLGDEAAPLELDEVVHLLLGEVLHRRRGGESLYVRTRTGIMLGNQIELNLI